DQAVTRALADARIARSVFLANEHGNAQQAHADARVAYEIAPQKSVWAVHTLCQATILFAWEKFRAKDLRAADWLVGEAEKTLAEGERLFPGHEKVAECRRDLQELRDIMEPRQRPPDRLPELPPLDQMLQQATIKQAQKDFAGAVQDYHQIL